MTADALPPELPPGPPGAWDEEAWRRTLRAHGFDDRLPADPVERAAFLAALEAGADALDEPPEPSRAWVTVRGECPKCGKRYNATVRADRPAITCARLSCAHRIELPPMEAP